MKTRPILFSTPMVQALLEGRKTQTRRICKDEIIEDATWAGGAKILHKNGGITGVDALGAIPGPYRVGDILWVRETFCDITDMDGGDLGFIYKADLSLAELHDECYRFIWKPSIFMPKAACRLFLKVSDVRLEQLQDISEADALDEGLVMFTKDGDLFKYGLEGDSIPWMDKARSPQDAYKSLWQSINGVNSWAANPWVWVVTFEVVEKPADFC